MSTRTFLGFGNEQSKIEAIGGAYTVKSSDHGKIFTLVTSGTDGAAITLPAPQAGLKYRFVTGAAFATTAWTVVATGAIIQGSVVVDGAAVPVAGGTTITFAAAAETIGDFIEITSDGTSWFIEGVAEAAGGITAA